MQSKGGFTMQKESLGAVVEMVALSLTSFLTLDSMDLIENPLAQQR